MKLRNKKTGEIVEAGSIYFEGQTKIHYSLAELNEEWEDYEEPKDFWYIDPEIGIAVDSTDPALWDRKYDIEFMKSLGNYFETKEEAEKAVEKLKAWKRLKDKGITFSLDEDGSKPFVRIDSEKETGTFQLVLSITEDLDLLFGGEE